MSWLKKKSRQEYKVPFLLHQCGLEGMSHRALHIRAPQCAAPALILCLRVPCLVTQFSSCCFFLTCALSAASLTPPWLFASPGSCHLWCSSCARVGFVHNVHSHPSDSSSWLWISSPLTVLSVVLSCSCRHSFGLWSSTSAGIAWLCSSVLCVSTIDCTHASNLSTCCGTSSTWAFSFSLLLLTSTLPCLSTLSTCSGFNQHPLVSPSKTVSCGPPHRHFSAARPQ